MYPLIAIIILGGLLAAKLAASPKNSTTSQLKPIVKATPIVTVAKTASTSSRPASTTPTKTVVVTASAAPLKSTSSTLAARTSTVKTAPTKTVVINESNTLSALEAQKKKELDAAAKISSGLQQTRTTTVRTLS